MIVFWFSRLEDKKLIELIEESCGFMLFENCSPKVETVIIIFVILIKKKKHF